MRIEDYMLPCLTKKFLGYECMGCGIQRSVSLLLKGQFLDAFFMYPAIYPLIVLLVILAYNHFFSLKNANYIIRGLIILTISTIFISYFIKLTKI